MMMTVRPSGGHDLAETPFGGLALETGLYSDRIVSAEDFGEALSNRHQQAFCDGVVGYIYTRADAAADGVVRV